MISFESDYICGAHPEVMKRLQETNLECLSGYGTDHYCDSAKEKIRKACGCEQAEVEFLTGGTQTNAVVVATMLKDSQLFRLMMLQKLRLTTQKLRLLTQRQLRLMLQRLRLTMRQCWKLTRLT